MKRLFMLSGGEYSDYFIGGLYESGLNIDNPQVIERLKLEFHKELGFDDIVEDVISSHKELVTGLKVPGYNNGNFRSFDQYYEGVEKVNKRYEELGYSEDSTSFEKWLVKNTDLKKLEYTELHEVI